MIRRRDTREVTGTRPGALTKHTLFETARFFADVYVLEPGQAQATHRHAAEDKCYLVLEGRPRVTSGTETHDVEPGEIVWCPAGDEHGVSNPGPGRARLLVFMAPHPRAASIGS